MSKLYLAYGANTNRDHMSVRCPGARYIANIRVPDHQLVFRGVADIVPARGRETVCALWLITPECEEALDSFEGFPYGYTKKYITIPIDGRRHRGMLYVMTAERRGRGQHWPPKSYEECLREGYADCGMNGEQIDEALALVKRWKARNGRDARPAGGVEWRKKDRADHRSQREASRTIDVYELLAMDPDAAEVALDAALRSIADAN